MPDKPTWASTLDNAINQLAEIPSPEVDSGLLAEVLGLKRQQLADLPAGVSLAPGRIILEGFTTIEQAQQQILALIMALGNDPDGFAELVVTTSVVEGE